ncbi:MAG: outer membrane lipoprotein carrier protein LolA [Labilithrix sp.]|nr:outer membrane lipoprotein carrier protein LolA [Labilithrix sp.]
MTARELVLVAVLASPAVAWSAPSLADATDTGAPHRAGASPSDAREEKREALDGPKLDALLADIAKARKNVKTLRAAFTQERRIALLATSVKSRGELMFGAPDRLRWDLAPPDDVVYFIGPEGLSYKTKTSTATVPAGGADVARALGDLRALLTGDLASLRGRYTLSASRSAGDVEVSGVAKDTKASVKSFTLLLDKGLVIPIRAGLLEGKRDRVDLAFSNVVVDGPIDPARLRP